MTRQPRIAILAAALALGGAAPVFAQDARDERNQAPAHRALGMGDTNSLEQSTKLQLPPRALAGHSVVTREEVREDYQAAREAGALTPDGNIGDDTRTLMAREQYSQQVGAQAQAELDRQAAMDAAAAAGTSQSSTPSSSPTPMQQQGPAPVAPFGVNDTVNPQSPAAGATGQ